MYILNYKRLCVRPSTGSGQEEDIGICRGSRIHIFATFLFQSNLIIEWCLRNKLNRQFSSTAKSRHRVCNGKYKHFSRCPYLILILHPPQTLAFNLILSVSRKPNICHVWKMRCCNGVVRKPSKHSILKLIVFASGFKWHCVIFPVMNGHSPWPWCPRSLLTPVSAIRWCEWPGPRVWTRRWKVRGCPEWWPEPGITLIITRHEARNYTWQASDKGKKSWQAY